MFVRVLTTVFSATFITLSLPVAAQNAPGQFRLELNAAAETEAGDCRLTYVVTNETDAALARTAYELGVFDIQGVVQRLLVLELGALAAGKTKILQFDLAGSPCASISRILVNDVAACTLAEGQTETDLCLSGLAASSRTAIQFGL
jgi:hypothetical protein